MSKIRPRIDKGRGSSIPWASADDPIYTRGFTVGMTRSLGSSTPTAGKVLPTPNVPSRSQRDAPHVP